MVAKAVQHSQSTVKGSLRVFSIYADLPASVRARWAYKTICHLAGENWIVSSELWKIDFLKASDNVCKMIVEAGARADIILVAVSALDCRQNEFVSWLEKVAAHNTSRPDGGLLIGLFGDDGNLTTELGWTVKQFIRCSCQIGRKFIWQWMGKEAMQDRSWLADNLERFLGDHHTGLELKSFSPNLGRLAAPQPVGCSKHNRTEQCASPAINPNAHHHCQNANNVVAVEMD